MDGGKEEKGKKGRAIKRKDSTIEHKRLWTRKRRTKEDRQEREGGRERERERRKRRERKNESKARGRDCRRT